MPCLGNKQFRCPGKHIVAQASDLPGVRVSGSGSPIRKRHLTGPPRCSGGSLASPIRAKRPPQHALGVRPGSQSCTAAPALPKALRSSHRVDLVAATKSPPHSCPPEPVRLGLRGCAGDWLAREPRPAAATFLRESTRLLAWSPPRRVPVAVSGRVRPRLDARLPPPL